MFILLLLVLLLVYSLFFLLFISEQRIFLLSSTAVYFIPQSPSAYLIKLQYQRTGTVLRNTLKTLRFSWFTIFVQIRVSKDCAQIITAKSSWSLNQRQTHETWVSVSDLQNFFFYLKFKMYNLIYVYRNCMNNEKFWRKVAKWCNDSITVINYL